MTHRAPGRRHRGGIGPVRLSGMFPDDEAAGEWVTERHRPQRPHCGTVRVQPGATHTTMPCRCRGLECSRRFSVRTVSLGTIVYNSQKFQVNSVRWV